MAHGAQANQAQVIDLMYSGRARARHGYHHHPTPGSAHSWMMILRTCLFDDEAEAASGLAVKVVAAPSAVAAAAEQCLCQESPYMADPDLLGQVEWQERWRRAGGL